MRNEKSKIGRRPRILWANRYCLLDTSSGGSMSIYQILKQLKAQGWDVEVFGATIFDSERGILRLSEHWDAIQKNPDKMINVQDDGIVHHLVVTEAIQSSNMTLAESSRWYHAYCALLDQFKPDLVFFYGGSAVDLLISSEARTRGIPSAAYLVNENYSGARWCQDVDLIITDTQATSDYYFKKDSIRPVPVGKFIVPDKVIPEHNQRKRVVFINPSLQKGAGIVAQLAILLEKSRPDIQFEIVESRGNWHDVVVEVTNSLGEKRESLSNVIVTPNTDDIRSVYSNARILLLPSLWWESGARVLAESMLNGIPAIVTAYGGNQEMIQNGGVYFTVPPECHEKPYTKLPNIELMKPLADKIVQFFDDEQYYQTYVERAYAVGKRLHDINVSTQRLIEAFRPLIEKRAGDLDHQALLKQVHKHGISGKGSEKTSAIENDVSIQDIDNFLNDQLASTEESNPGGILWLINKETQFGGFHKGVVRNKKSALDPRKPNEYSAGYIEKDGEILPTHIGGDRMSFKHHGYSLAYSTYFRPFLKNNPNRKMTIVEIGILKGTGLAIWCDLFPGARVIGLDLDPSIFMSNKKTLKKYGAFSINEPEIYEFDQFKDNKDLLGEILKGSSIDIVIDDGAHTHDAIVKTFESIKAFLSPEFLYFVEDYQGIDKY